jgi:AcrR family transcriptional regulator
MGMPKAETATARDRILCTASELFYERGFHAVGIDLIIERAGVAKATLYRHFPTKDDLISAYLEDADARFSEWFDASINPDVTPAEALVGIFDSVAILATSPECLGCTFQVTAAEFPEASHPGHAVALAHKQAVRGRLRELSKETGARRPDELADGLLLLMDGAFAAARMHGHDNPGGQVGAVARTLIAAHASPQELPGRQRPHRAR